MTTTQVFIFMLIAILLYEIWTFQRNRFTCNYCGIYMGHDDHCPYIGTGL